MCLGSLRRDVLTVSDAPIRPRRKINGLGTNRDARRERGGERERKSEREEGRHPGIDTLRERVLNFRRVQNRRQETDRAFTRNGPLPLIARFFFRPGPGDAGRGAQAFTFNKIASSTPGRPIDLAAVVTSSVHAGNMNVLILQFSICIFKQFIFKLFVSFHGGGKHTNIFHFLPNRVNITKKASFSETERFPDLNIYFSCFK